MNDLPVASRSRGFRLRGGFTLVEILLVLVLIGILTVVTLPNFVQSMRGNRLRTAVRAVVTSGRYARSMAVLRQKSVLLTFDLTNSSILVEEIVMAAVEEQPSGEDEEEISESEEDEPQYGVVSRQELLSRKLEEVFIQSVETDNEVFTEGSASIIYSNNGRCTPYVVKVVDAKGKGSMIEVDALSSARTEAL